MSDVIFKLIPKQYFEMKSIRETSYEIEYSYRSHELIYLEREKTHYTLNGRTYLTWDRQCHICFEKVDRPCISNNCYHMFCLRCFVEWLQLNNTCPVCRNMCTKINYDFETMLKYSCKYVFSDKYSYFGDLNITFDLSDQILSQNSHLSELFTDKIPTDNSEIVQIRRFIYQLDLQTIPFKGKNSSIVDPSKLKFWIERELSVLFPYVNSTSDKVNMICKSLVENNFETDNEEKFSLDLLNILGKYALKFITELNLFLDYNCSVEVYDSIVNQCIKLYITEI